jgi:hypothetical protein
LTDTHILLTLASVLSKDELRARLLQKIPDWILACEESVTDTVIMHQEAFAPRHEDEEIMLLGWAIKYAGMCGKSVQIVPSQELDLTDSAQRV